MTKPRYRKIGASFFTDEKVVTLSPTEKLVALYLLIGQVNRIGLYVFSPAKAQEELGLSRKTFQKSFQRVLEVLGWSYDPVARVVFIVSWWKFNQPENPNVLVGALRDLDGLPQTELVNYFADHLWNLSPNLHETFKKGLGEHSSNQYQEQYQEQKQEQEQEQNQEQENPPLVPLEQGGPVMVPPQLLKLIDEWNQIPGLMPFQGSPTKPVIRAFHKVHEAFADHPNIWTEVLSKLKSDSHHFLKGGGNNSWQASLIWLLKPTTVAKVLAGDYE